MHLKISWLYSNLQRGMLQQNLTLWWDCYISHLPLQVCILKLLRATVLLFRGFQFVEHSGAMHPYLHLHFTSSSLVLRCFHILNSFILHIKKSYQHQLRKNSAGVMPQICLKNNRSTKASSLSEQQEKVALRKSLTSSTPKHQSKHFLVTHNNNKKIFISFKIAAADGCFLALEWSGNAYQRICYK